ncbi:MAG: hypothetical protein L7U83_03115 [Akkermansiaceae bacterium]|nr:hypothetical protein [Akkermansiaceae bacterium]
MRTILLCLSLFPCFAFTSCSLTATGYPVAGPAAKTGEILKAKFTYNGFGTGTVSVTLPSGEYCKGPYSTVVGGVMSSDVLSWGSESGVISGAVVSSGGINGLQTTRAVLVGDRGSIIDVEGYTSGASPTHGFGKAKDNKGSVWKLIW